MSEREKRRRRGREGDERKKERKTLEEKKNLSLSLFVYLLLDVLDDGVDVDLVVGGLDGDGGALRGRAGGLFCY